MPPASVKRPSGPSAICIDALMTRITMCRKVVIVANLQAAKLMGIESNGMVLAASIGGEPSLLSVDASVPAGTKVK
jgi:hypothetical protein